MGRAEQLPFMKRLLPLVALVAAGCASNSPADADNPETAVRAEYDPMESLNRSMYAINDAFDRATLKPIARGYKAVVPEFARRGVTNFSRNLFTPRSAVNNFLQGKPGPGFSGNPEVEPFVGRLPESHIVELGH